MLALLPTRDDPGEALVRLARKAESEGVRIYRDARDDRFYASSVSRPGHLHHVTRSGCDCVGFANHGRCKHHAALLAALGTIAIPADPGPVVTTHHVDGHYAPGGWLVGGAPEWRPEVTTIALDGVEMVRISGERDDLQVHWLEQGRPVDSLTACTPRTLTHEAAVAYWRNELAPDTPAMLPPQPILEIGRDEPLAA